MSVEAGGESARRECFSSSSMASPIESATSCQPRPWLENLHQPGPPVPFSPFFSPTKIDYRKKGTLILTSLLGDLTKMAPWGNRKD